MAAPSIHAPDTTGVAEYVSLKVPEVFHQRLYVTTHLWLAGCLEHIGRLHIHMIPSTQCIALHPDPLQSILSTTVNAATGHSSL